MPLQIGDEVELPEGVALIVETGCTQCDGPTEGLLRVYRGPAGQARVDTLFSVKAQGLPPRVVPNPKDPDPSGRLEQPYIVGFALSADASEIVVGVCTRGYCGGLGFANPDAQTTLFRSLDGGVTWQRLEALDGGYFVAALAKDGVVLANFGTEQTPRTSYQLYPSGAPLEPPPQASRGWWPFTLPSGELLWRTDDGRLLRSDGSAFLVLALGPNARLTSFTPDLTHERFVVGWVVDQLGRPSVLNYLGLATRDGRIVKAFSLGDQFAHIGGWLTPNIVVGDAWGPWLLSTTPSPFSVLDIPTLLDVDNGTIHPIPGLPLPRGRNNVQAVLRGPFARVAGTGSCLNVRAEPGAAAAILNCAADGVLLRDLGETRETDGQTWRRVTAPGGITGWASAAYLER